MTGLLPLLFFLIAAIMFGLATFNIPARFSLIAAGLLSFTIPFVLVAAKPS